MSKEEFKEHARKSFLGVAQMAQQILKVKQEMELKQQICEGQLELALRQKNEEGIKKARDAIIAAATEDVDSRISWYKKVCEFEAEAIAGAKKFEEEAKPIKE